MEDFLPLGNRTEPMIDTYLFSECRGLSLRPGTPVCAGDSFVFERPWEGSFAAYCSLVQDGERALFFYRGLRDDTYLRSDSDVNQMTCVAESRDGVHFTRVPAGSLDAVVPGTNAFLTGPDSHNFAPFLDTNPACRPDERFKAVAGETDENGVHGLHAYASPDGLHWHRMTEAPVITDGQFDSHNVAFYDACAGIYRCYCRYWDADGNPTGDYVGVRAITSCTSEDFLHWTKPCPNRYDSLPGEHFYTNATIPFPGAEHILLSMPMRFAPDRKRNADWPETGVSDSVLMSSRNGTDWDRPCKEAFIRAGTDPLNWGDRSQMMARGAYVHPDGTVSLYISRHYRTRSNRMERLTLRPEGFMSLHAGWDGGELLTKPLVFGRGTLHINASTGAYGHVRILPEYPDGTPVPGFGDAPLWYGDTFREAYPFGGDFSALAGTPVRLRISLRDADLYSLRAE